MTQSILKTNLKAHLRAISKNMTPSANEKLSESEMKQRVSQEFAINSMRIENGVNFFKRPGA